MLTRTLSQKANVNFYFPTYKTTYTTSTLPVFPPLHNKRLTPEKCYKTSRWQYKCLQEGLQQHNLNNSKGQPTIINVGAAYPNSPFTVDIFRQALVLFATALEVYHKSATVCLYQLFATGLSIKKALVAAFIAGATHVFI